MSTPVRHRRHSVRTLLLVLVALFSLTARSSALAAPTSAPLGAVFTATVVAPSYSVVNITTTSEHPHTSLSTEEHLHTVPHEHSTTSTSFIDHSHTDVVGTRTWSETTDHSHTDVGVRVWSLSEDHLHSTTVYIPWSYTTTIVTESSHPHTWYVCCTSTPVVQYVYVPVFVYLIEYDSSGTPHNCSYWSGYWTEAVVGYSYSGYWETQYHTHWDSRQVTYSGVDPVTTQFNHPHTVTMSEPTYNTYNHLHTNTMSEPIYNTYNHPHPETVTVLSNHDHPENHVHTTLVTTPHTHTTVTPTLVAGAPAPQTISADNSNSTYKMPNLALQPVVTIAAGNTIAGNETIVWPLNHDLPLGVRAGVGALPYALMPDGSVVQGLSATVNSIRYYGATKNDADVSSLYTDAWLNKLDSERTQVLTNEPSLGSPIADPTQGSFRLILQGTVRLFFLANVTMIWADGTVATLDLPTVVDVRNATSGLSQ